MVPVVGVLMGAAEIAERIGVSRQRAQQLMGRPDWPKPYDTLAMGKVFKAEDIEAWIREHRPDLVEGDGASQES